MGHTLYEIQTAGLDRSRRDLPRAITAALRLIWRAGRRELISVCVLEVLSAVGYAALVLLGQKFVSAALSTRGQDSQWSELAPAIIAVTGLSAALSIGQALVARQQQMLAELTARHAQATILEVGSTVEVASFDEPAFHDSISRAQSAVSRAPVVVQSAIGLIQSGAGALGALIALAALKPALVPLAVLAVAPAVLLSGRRAEAFYRFAYSVTPRDRERNYLASLLSHRESAKEVRAMQLAGYLRNRHDTLYEHRVAELRTATARQLRYALVGGLATSAIVGLSLALLLALTFSGQVSGPSAAAAAGALLLLSQRLSMGSMSAENLLEAAMFVEDYLAFLALAPAYSAPAERPAAAGAVGPIATEAVWFSYAGSAEPTLRGVSMHIEPGEVVALVGANGSGKTTLAKLLAGLYVPERGRVVIHGVDSAEVDRDALRNQVGIIFQDFERYDLPVYDNIALGRHKDFHHQDRVVDAALRAGVHEDLQALADGYDTQLGPEFVGGVDLSLGQWQKVALARLFFRNAPFVILDEPTASLDAQSEHDLFARIRTLFAGRSVLLISHRFSSVRDADRIYVLDKGQIIEQGDHEALMAQDGRYAELFSLQASAYVR